MFLFNLIIYCSKTNPIMILVLNMYLGISMLLMFLSNSFMQWLFIFISMLYTGGMMIMFSFCICMVGKEKTFNVIKKYFIFFFPLLMLTKKFFIKWNSDLNINMSESLFSIFVMFLLMIFISFMITFMMKDKKCLKTLN